MGYQQSTKNQFGDADDAVLWPAGVVAAAGITIASPVVETDRGTARLVQSVSARTGTNPTLDVTIQTSFDRRVWRTVGTFDQKTEAGLTMGAVASTGTTPPAITLTGTPDRYIDLRITVVTAGARGTGTIRYSIDGGVTFSGTVTSAATINVLDPQTGVNTGLVLNYANATSNADNVWTAKTAGFERKTFSGLSRFVRAVANVGGTGGPTFTFGVSGELV